MAIHRAMESLVHPLWDVPERFETCQFVVTMLRIHEPLGEKVMTKKPEGADTSKTQDADLERLWAEMRMGEGVDFREIAKQVFVPSRTQKPTLLQRLCFWKRK